MSKQKTCHVTQQFIAKGNKLGAPEYEERYIEEHLKHCDKCRRLAEQYIVAQDYFSEWP